MIPLGFPMVTGDSEDFGREIGLFCQPVVHFFEQRFEKVRRSHERVSEARELVEGREDLADSCLAGGV